MMLEPFIYLLALFHVAYIIAIIRKDFSVIDTFWPLGFVVVAMISFSDMTNLRALIMSSIILLWGLRLASFLHKRNMRLGEDKRYNEMRTRWGNTANIQAYFKVFLFQGILNYIVALPIIFINNAEAAISILDFIAAAVAIFGLVYETIADEQKYKFKNKNPKQRMKKGLWKYSQYPNYFGEIVFWWGIFLFSFTPKIFIICLFSPFFITYLILKFSGIPYLKDNYKKDDYSKNTPILIPNWKIK